MGDFNGNGIPDETFSYSGMVNFLDSRHRRNVPGPGTTSARFHSKEGQDDWRNDTNEEPEYDIIIGRQLGQHTIGQVTAQKKYGCYPAYNPFTIITIKCRYDDYFEPRMTLGDGTVPLQSASRHGNGQDFNKRNGSQNWFKYPFSEAEDWSSEHTNLTQNERVHDLILYLLGLVPKRPAGWYDDIDPETGLPREPQQQEGQASLAGAPPAGSSPSLYFMVKGADFVAVSDSQGNTSSKIDETFAERIPNVYYTLVGERLVSINMPANQNYSLSFRTAEADVPVSVQFVRGVNNMTPTHVARYIDLALPQPTPTPTATPTPTPEPTPQPAGSVNGLIAFEGKNADGNWDIYVMNAGGGNRRRLTTSWASDSQPVWSPDGSQIAFVSERDGPSEIYVMNPDGTNQTRLTNSPDDNYDPVWSPDGSMIAFRGYRDPDNEIFVMDADGGNLRNLSNDDTYNETPCWSPDSRRIVFTNYDATGAHIYAVDADGNNLVALRTGTDANYEPAWSPDGSRIAFISTRTNSSQVFAMNPDGSNPTQLSFSDPANPSAYDAGPVYSHDGSSIAFERNIDSMPEIYVMKADGSALTRLTNNPARDANPFWSPDGNTVGFTGTGLDGNDEIYTIRTNGTQLRDLTLSASDEAGGAWQRRVPTQPLDAGSDHQRRQRAVSHAAVGRNRCRPQPLYLRPERRRALRPTTQLHTVRHLRGERRAPHFRFHGHDRATVRQRGDGQLRRPARRDSRPRLCGRQRPHQRQQLHG